MCTHKSVLHKESIDALSINPNGWYFDGTFGRGGHSKAILDKLSKNGRLYATDQDPSALDTAKGLNNSRFFFALDKFSNFDKNFPEIIEESLDGALFDLGVSSPQLDNPERGFSFTRNGVLDMRMNPNNKLNAKEFVNESDFKTLCRVIFKFGEERFAKSISKKIIKARESEAIETTKQLAEIVSSGIPAKFHVPGRHPATKTFQAIRIFVNDEIGEIETTLPKLFKALKIGGRLVVISFHSLEDKSVKNFVNKFEKSEPPPEIPIFDNQSLKKIRLIGRPVRPSQEEIEKNPRARSSIMRILEKL